MRCGQLNWRWWGRAGKSCNTLLHCGWDTTCFILNMNHPPVYSKKNLSRAPEGARLSHMLLTQHTLLNPRFRCPTGLAICSDHEVPLSVLHNVASLLLTKVGDQARDCARDVASFRLATCNRTDFANRETLLSRLSKGVDNCVTRTICNLESQFT